MPKPASRQTDALLPNQIAALERQLGPIEYRSVAELTAYERNPRKHPER